MISRNIFPIKKQLQVIPLARNPREKKKQQKNMLLFFGTIVYSLTVLFPFKFKWWYDTSMVWIAGHSLFFPLGFLLYLRYASHFVEYGSQKSPIEVHISTCFLVHFVFCCFLCFLICLFLLHFFHFFRRFHFLFFSVFHVLSLFHVFFIFSPSRFTCMGFLLL